MEEQNGFKTWWPVVRVAAILGIIYAVFGSVIEFLWYGFITVCAAGAVLLLANDGSKILVNIVSFLARWQVTAPFAQILGQETVKESERAKENGKSKEEIKGMDLAAILSYLKPEKKAEGKTEAKENEVTLEQLQALMAQLEALKADGSKEEVKEETKEEAKEGKAS